TRFGLLKPAVVSGVRRIDQLVFPQTMGEEIVPVRGADIQRIVDMAVYPSQEPAPQMPPDARPFVDQGRIATEKHGQLAMKMPQAFQMAVEAPAEYEERIGPPGSDLRVERRVDQTAEMMGAGVRSHVFDKTMGIAFQQGNVPLDLGSEIGVVFRPGRRLLPGIEHTWIERGV